jgi:ribonucleoside-diphosphate reductase alpha chain
MSLRNDIWKRQYAVTKEEDITQGQHRVAEAMAAVDEDPASSAERFYRLMADNLFWPGGRVLAGAATAHGNMLNCFVTDGSPQAEGTTPWILETARKLALITKVGGGNGVNLDQITPRKAFTGPVGSLGLYIDPGHADADLVHSGTFLNQVTGDHETRGYRHAVVIHDSAAHGGSLISVPDSVDGIWTSAATMTGKLLAGEDVLIDLSGLRAEGEPVQGSGGTSSGPASFAVEVFDSFAYWATLGGAEHAGPVATLRYIFANTLRAIRQGGTRRGAGMATLTATHPDVRDFITCKDLDREQAEGDIGTFNISVLVSDDFMRQSHTPDSPAATLLHEIADHAHQTGEPGVLYVDRINEHNALALTDGPIMSTNPCVTADTWVSTQTGPQQVRNLVGKRFCAVVDGRTYPLASEGFWSTGVKPIFQVRTKRGFELRLTANHRLRKVINQTRDRQESEWLELSNLNVGDSIMLQDHRAVNPWAGRGSITEGWLLGSLVGDGTFITDKSEPLAALDYWGSDHQAWAQLARNDIEQVCKAGSLWLTTGDDRSRVASAGLARLAADFGIRHGTKTVTDEVESAGYDFYRGFLRGLFDADGSVQGSQEKGVSVRLAQSDRQLLQRVQRMLARLGVISTIYEERRPAGERQLPDGRGGSKAHACRADHELVIANDNLLGFQQHISFEDGSKRARLEALLASYQRQPNRERFSDEIISIAAAGEEEVFDVTVEQVHAFDANGFSAHNCGEIPLYPAEPCDLGAINLASHFSADNEFDFTLLERTTRTAIRFLDNVLTAEIAPLPDIAEAIADKRRIGLGVMGLADMLIRLGLRYDTPEGRDFVARALGVIRDAALQESCRLGELRGVPAGPARAGLERRNIALLTVAPTGTTSMLAECSSGLEPVFAAAYTRRIGTDYRAIVHPLLLGLLQEIGDSGSFVTAEGKPDWEALAATINEHHGSIQPLLDEGLLPDDPRLRAFVVAHDIEPVNHVLMQATVQRVFDWRDGERTYAGNSISKTINLPNEAVVADVLAAYELGWTEQLKGITVYRDGSRQLQVLTTGPKKKTKSAAAAAPAPAAVQAPPAAGLHEGNGRGDGIIERPAVIHGASFKHELANKKVYVQVFLNQHDQVVEVWTPASKGATPAESTTHEIIGRLASLALKHGAPAESVAASFEGHMDSTGGISRGTGYVGSKWDLVANAIRTVQGEGNPAADWQGSAGTDACPECETRMIRQEGCLTCLACGFTLCG